jgi:hypothetical protein
LATSPCIDHRHDLPVALVNTAPSLNGNSRLDIVVSGDDLDFAKVVRAASAQATVTVSGRTNVMWCDSGKHSNRNNTICKRLNASTSGCDTATGGSSDNFTRAPRVVGTSLQDLKSECSDKLCVLQNISLNITGESLSDTNQSLHTFSTCSQNHPQGVRFDHVELEQSTEVHSSGQDAPAVTLMEQCAGLGDDPSLDDLVGTCDCTQCMWGHHQDEPMPHQHNTSNLPTKWL